MFTQIHSTTITVTDQNAALDFYINTLGWQLHTDNMMGPDMRWLTVVPPGGTTQLVLALPNWADNGRVPGGHTGISLVAPDIEAAYTQLSERGVHFKEPVATMPWGGKATWFSDPDGNQFFLVDA